MSDPVQVNMYGIRYFIDGDLSDPLVKKLMVQARNDLQQIKSRNINNIPHIWLNKPNAYKIVSQFGIDSAYIDVPAFKAAEYKGEKEEVTKTEKEAYRFVPAICIGNPGLGSYYTYDVDWQTESNISVCAASNWDGIVDIIINSPTAKNPGEIYKDGLQSDKLEIMACRNWGNREFEIDYDTDNEEDSFTETFLKPAPYLGRGNDGGVDYLIHDLNAIHPYCYNYDAPQHPITIAAIDAAHSDPDFNDQPQFLSWCDGYCDSYIPSGLCCNQFVHSVHFVVGQRCGGGHLFFQYRAKGYYEVEDFPSCFYYLGICFYGQGEYNEVTIIEPIELTTVGEAQEKTVTDRYYEKYSGLAQMHWQVGGDMYRSGGGTIPFDFGYELFDLEENVFSMPEPCVTSQTYMDDYFELVPYNYGLPGAYIQDIGAEEYICPISSFKNKYLLMIVEDLYEYNYSSLCRPWNLTGYGYDLNGIYDQGSYQNCLGGTSTEENYHRLCANLNGERIEIDVGEDEFEFFQVTDSLILDFMGIPVYMYAYVKHKYPSQVQTPRVLYTRYGYFLNDIHYQSEKFYPAGVLNDMGWFTCLHDVFGSVDRDGSYGYGQCAGYIIKEKTQTEKRTVENAQGFGSLL